MCFSTVICRGSGGAKSRLATAEGAEPSGQMRDEKLRAAVTRSTFPSRNAKNTTTSEHFWKLRCSKKCTPLWREAHFEVKMAKAHQVRSTFGRWDVEKVHGCGAKHMSKSKFTKHTSSGPLLEVEMSKKCKRLWRKDAQSTLARNHHYKFNYTTTTTTKTTTKTTTTLQLPMPLPPHCKYNYN